MNVFLRIALCLTAALLGTAVLQAQSKKVSDALLNSGSGSQGNEFLVAFPCNDNSPFERDAQFEIYIGTSANVANVRVKIADDAGEKRFQVLKNTITTMSLVATGPLQLPSSVEIRAAESERVIPKSISILSDQPISVYVLSAKSVSSDGYLALPVSVWGRRYMPIAFYDFKELNGQNTWAGGFVIIAKDDETDVNILLRGTGDGLARTRGGKRIGEMFTINMRKGDVYQLMGDGTTPGEFDLTGSLITSTKPIGLISFHSRTALPGVGFNGRDPLYEMTPPISAWGKLYTTVEYNRSGTNQIGRGDYYRVVAAEDGTVVTGVYLDKITKQRLGTLNTPTLRSGQFIDFTKTRSSATLPYGVIAFQSTKPFFVMQYNTSSSFDGDPVADPFMINVTPAEQFITGTIFQTPTVSNFSEHYLNLMIEVRHPETEIEDLRSLSIDGIPVFQHPGANIAPLLLTPESVIPAEYVGGKRMRHATVVFGERGGTHVLTSNGRIRFGGYIYGTGQFDSYGWPAAAAFRDVSTVDTLKPQFTKTEVCGDFTYNATEIRNQPDPPVVPPTRDSMQVETGFFSIRLDTTDNYRLVFVTSPNGDFPRDPAYFRYSFRVEVIDKGRDAFAIVAMQDFADNITYDTISYFADRLTVNPREINFGRMRLGTSARQSFTITNTSGADVTLNDLRFKGTASGKFTIISGDIPPSVVVPNNASHRIEIEYQANEETTDPRTDWDIDTLVAKTVCSEFNLALRGMAVMPRITVVDWDAGTRALNEEICLTAGLRITNPGTDTLVISQINGVAGSFRISNPTVPALPIRIPPAVFAPQNVVLLQSACFQRSSVGSETIDVTFATNGAEGDSVSNWIGRTQAPGPFIKGHDFGSLRENSVRRFLPPGNPPAATADCIIFNTGTETIRLTGVRFVDGGGQYWPAGSAEANYVFKIGAVTQSGTAIGAGIDLTSVNGVPNEIVSFEVFFRPNIGIPATISTAAVEAVFATAGVAPVSDNLRGEGLRPTASVNTVTMTCDETPEGVPADNNLLIPNGGTMPLTISNIQLTGAAAWSFVTPPTFPLVVQPGVSESIPIRFRRPIGDQRGFNVDLAVTHDGEPGNGIDEAVVTSTSPARWSVSSCDGPIPAVTNLGFGAHRTECDTPEGEFVISVTGGGRPVEVRSIEPLGPDNASFQIIEILAPNGVVTNVPFFASPGESFRVRVRFVPTRDGNHSTRYQIRNFAQGDNTELVPDLISTVTGSSARFPVTFNLVNDLPAGQSRNPGEEVRFTVNVNATDYPNLQFDGGVLTVNFNSLSLGFIANSIQVEQPGWTVSEPQLVPATDPNRSQWVFTVAGPGPMTANGNLFSFRSILLLAPEIQSNQTLAASLPRLCQVPTTTGTQTAINNCALSQRIVNISRSNFSLTHPMPNPATSGTVSVDFGVGIKAETLIDLVDINGNVVRTFVQTQLSAGEYTLAFPTTGLANGAYVLRMQSGPFNQSQRLVIAD